MSSTWEQQELSLFWDPMILGPGIPDFCIHLGAAEEQINLSAQCSYLEAYLLSHIFSSDHL